MLDDDHGRAVAKRGAGGEFSRKFKCGIGVVVVVVRQLLALDLLSLRQAGHGRAARHIKRGGLMRVLAIAQRAHQCVRACQHLREVLLLVDRGKPLRDRSIISGRRSIGLCRHRAAECQRRLSAGLVEFGGQRCVVGRIGQDSDELVVLGRRAHHRRSTDIDVLDHFVAFRALGHGCLERIEVDHDQIDRADRMFGHGGGMLGIVAHRQQPAVNRGVQRLDAAIHHFRKAGEVRNVLHRQPGLAQRLGGAPGRDQFHAARGQSLAKVHKAGLVGHRKQRPLDRHIAHVLKILSHFLEQPREALAAAGNLGLDHQLPHADRSPLAIGPETVLDGKRRAP